MDMPSLNPESTFNGREPSEARFHPLDVGLVVSVAHRLSDSFTHNLSDSFTHNHSNPVAATVGQVGPELVVQLARPHQKLPFEERDEVLIKFWDEDRIAYFWQANVKNCSSVGYLTLSILDAGMTIQQRKSPRVSGAIPLSYTIIDAADIQLNGEKVSEVMTQNISMGGVFFEQGLLLTVGDKLELQLHLPSSEPVCVVGWVVRCERISVDKRPLHSVAVEFLQIDEMNEFRLMESLVQLQNTQPLKRNQTLNYRA